MKSLRYFSLFLLLLTVISSQVLAGASAPARTTVKGGEILWDSYGVPHIYGKDEASVFYGFGWAQAHSHGNAILKLYGQARGKGAEYWGESYLASDEWVASNAVYERSGQWYQQQTANFRQNLDAFAQGINDYAAKHPDNIEAEIQRVLPLTGVDIVAHSHWLMNYNYIASQRQILGEVAPLRDAAGSNAWAVAPSRSASGNTMLLANPHLPWDVDFFTYYEAHLNGPGINIYGATQIGLPVIRFAFTERHGFANTVNSLLGATSYKLTLSENGYVFDGETLPFETRTHTLYIRQDDGSLQPKNLTFRSTVHGPVFTRQDGNVIALRVAGLDRPHMLQQYWEMGIAKSFGEFVTALKKVQVPKFNIIYGDKEGNILYLHNGILPKHDKGGFADWNITTLVAGDTSDTLWHDIHSYDDLPKVVNPQSGFVQNANDHPWVSTYPPVLDPADYPPYVAPVGPMSMRAQISVLSLLSKPKLSFDDFVTLKTSTYSLMAERILPDLLAAARQDNSAELTPVIQILENWDKHFNADSKAALLFETWAELFLGGSARNMTVNNFAQKWTLDDPLNTPRGLADPVQAVEMLKTAAVLTVERYGALDRPFGEVSRFKINDVSFPGLGGFGNLGLFHVVSWSELKNGEREPSHGETWISMVEFSEPVKAWGLMTYGNSRQPRSAHRTDQLQHFADKKYRVLWTTKEQVLQNLESRTKY